MGALKYFFLFILSLAFATLFYRTGAVHHQHPPEMQSVINATHANVHLRLHHYVRGYYDAWLRQNLSSPIYDDGCVVFTPLDKSSTSISPRTKRQDAEQLTKWNHSADQNSEEWVTPSKMHLQGLFFVWVGSEGLRPAFSLLSPGPLSYHAPIFKQSEGSAEYIDE
ncbi:hypothetical protein HAX54_010509, partial [Datura stramonium]|nr:hypothetical protein [Datura stramonium]